MPYRRVYVSPAESSEAGCYHVVSRIVDRTFRLNDLERTIFARMLKAWAAFCQVEVLTFCVMSNHFHILVRVPERPTGFDLTTEEVLALLEPAVGKEWMKTLRAQLEIFGNNGSEEAVDEWRKGKIAGMFSLSGFMKALKQRFTLWYNRKSGRTGTLWEGRYTSVAVEDAERALRTMATYIDLNPVRAGMVEDPGGYQWCGYGEAMAGNAAALAGLARIVGNWGAGKESSERRVQSSEGETTEPEVASGSSSDEEAKTTISRKAGLRILVAYRQLLGLTGRARTREDGTVARRGVNVKLREKWESGRGVKREILLRRVQHLTRGVIFGSRAFIDEWFARNRDAVRGKSRTDRKTGARAIGKREDWRGLFSFRSPGG